MARTADSAVQTAVIQRHRQRSPRQPVGTSATADERAAARTEQLAVCPEADTRSGFSTPERGSQLACIATLALLRVPVPVAVRQILGRQELDAIA